MDGGTVTHTHEEYTEASIKLHTTHREDMAVWLALEVLMTDDMALADDALLERLVMLQDRLEEKLRTAAGL